MPLSTRARSRIDLGQFLSKVNKTCILKPVLARHQMQTSY
jgi:hypothetical protein